MLAEISRAVGLFLLLIIGVLLAPWIAPFDPFDVATLDLADAFLPPAWAGEGNRAYLLGTDGQGRDLLSAILHGLRTSLGIGLGAVLLAALLGVPVGLAAGLRGGWADALMMRLADAQLACPAFLVALLIDGIAHAARPPGSQAGIAPSMLILAIGLSQWAHFARTVRSATLAEAAKDYVLAARATGARSPRIAVRHILPNLAGPILALAALDLALAIGTEATLSFLGIGLPVSKPSLGTLIRTGSDFLFSGEWWIAFFPAAALALLTLAISILADRLRDALDPRTR